MTARANIIGKTFGRWYVVGHSYTNKYGIKYYTCKCIECNNSTVKRYNDITAAENDYCKYCKPRIDLTGKTYGELKVVSFSYKDTIDSYYNVECGCGIKLVMPSFKLVHGYEHCGAKIHHKPRYVNITHGLSHTIEYKIWQSMRQRCDNPNSSEYENYGGRGITYSSQWKYFINFYNDMGQRPDDTELDRIDVNKNYCKDNCRWTTHAINNLNKRKFNRSKYNANSTKLIGVRKTESGKYEARFRNKYLGVFDFEIDAANMYDNTKIKYANTSEIATNKSLNLLPKAITRIVLRDEFILYSKR